MGCAVRSPPSAGVGRRGRETGDWAPSSARSRARRVRSGPAQTRPAISSAYSPEPSSLTTESERSGKRTGSARRRSSRKASSAAASGRDGSRSPSFGCQRDDAVPALGYGKDPAQRRQPLLREIARGDAVGRDHEVLDQLLRPVLPFGTQIGERAAVEYRAHFERFQSQRALRRCERAAAPARPRPAVRSCSSEPGKRGKLLPATAPAPSSHAPTALYASFAWLRTSAR